MVFKKSIYNGGFDGFRAPVVPKAPRSLRRRSLQKQSSESSEICAFELLAAVAGKLLQEGESSTSSTGLEGKKQISILQECAKQEKLEVKVKHARSEYLDQGSCAESEFVPEPTNIELKLEPLLKELPQSDNDSGLENASIVTSSDFLKKVNTNVKLEASQSKNEVGDTSSKLEGVSPSHGDLCDVSLGSNRTEIQTEGVEKQNGDLAAVKACSYRDPMKSCVNSRVLNKSYSSVHLPFYRDPFPSACFPRHKGNVKIGIRDDDENSLRCIHRGTKTRTVRSQSRARYRRMRKMLTSKYWKAAPKLKDYELTNTTSAGVKPFYHKRKNIYIRESCKTEADNKRRKLFHHSSKPAFFQEGSSESISNSPEMSVTGHKRRQNSTLNRGVKSSIINHKGSFQSKENHVKFSIKSFKVPELYVEVPETATVGSLKRTVMEAVKAILGGELRVGVHLQGKKIRDENKTLQQTGISHNSDLETLGFTLEPSFPQASPSLIQKEPPLLLPCETHEQLSRPGESPIMDVGFLNSSINPPIRTSLENHVEKIQEIIPFETEVSVEERGADSKAIVPVSAVNAEALSMVPVSNKLTKRSELSQRRTRRPFSVSEVEALVEAVETLGTGRWRDVKMRSFDDANHRTYVDLKDKWKTLVHTASISPQQRRGEPVPQDLLDRVLAAHAQWSQHQSKQHSKHQTEPLLTSANTNVGH